MIELLIPLGLLGLLGIAALIIIYIIKPNFQTKTVTTTYIWKLSLRYRRKRPPTNKIRNILIFLCQLCILTLMAGILAMPVFVIERETDRQDVVFILDSSASMYAGYNGDIRFLRAIDKIEELAGEVFAEGGYVSLIVADDEPAYVTRRTPPQMRSQLTEALDALRTENSCFYGVSNIGDAMTLSEEVIRENNSATVCLVTDTEYESVRQKGVEVVSVAEKDEWNAAILGATAQLGDAFYELSVETACYGQDRNIMINVEIQGANASDSGSVGSSVSFSKQVYCDGDATKTVVFRFGGGKDEENVLYYDLSENERFFSYQTIHISIGEADAFPSDNVYDLYGGQKEVIRVQYASSDPNIFFSGALLTLRNAYRSDWDIQITEVKKGEEPLLEGFDLYIFEHRMPAVLPSDGIVFLMDPDTAPVGSGIRMGGMTDLMGESVSLTGGQEHPALTNILADNITVSRYMKIIPEEPFDILMTCDGDPVLLTAKEGSRQLAVMAFSVHYSNLPIMPEFILLLGNLFEYFLPATVNGNAFEVGEAITINGRGESVSFSGAELPITEFPTVLFVDLPGFYALTQTTYFGKAALPQYIFVKIPASESNIRRTELTLEGPERDLQSTFRYRDLLIYLAAAVVALLFAEWWLQSRETK